MQTQRKHNIILQRDKYAVILLDSSQGMFECLVDKADVALITSYYWTYRGGYVRAGKGAIHSLSRLLLGLGASDYKYVVDHINRNPLDNRRINLRKVTYVENARNTGMFSHNTSGYKGISWNRASAKWRVYGTLDGTFQQIGMFVKLEHAVAARQVWERANYA